LRNKKRTEESGKVISYSDPAYSRIGWSYAISRPMDSFLLSSYRLYSEIIVICTIVLAFGLIISYILSRRFYLPMKRLLFNIRNIYGMPKAFQNFNEYSFIDSTLHRLDDKVNCLQSELKKKQLLHIINGNATDLEDDLQIPLNCNYAVILVEMLEGKTKDFVEAFNLSNHSIKFNVIPMYAKQAIIFYFPDKAEPNAYLKMEQDLEKFTLLMKNSLKFRCVIGDIVNPVDNIRFSHENAKEAQSYFFLYPDKKIIKYQEFKERQGLTSIFNFNQFENALKAGDLDAVDTFLKQFGDTLSESQINMEAVQLSLVQLVSTLAKTAVELNIHDKMN
jgi:two-component system response regulator YesN